MHEVRRLVAQILASWAADLWPWESADDRRVKGAFANLMAAIAVQAKNHLDGRKAGK
jgi:hypothetical protein|tara:strand:- start:5566 stop:5736 length:171 start_codon:yes stop_codon:yes gene_type:complete